MEVLRRSSVFAAEVMEVFDRSPTDKELVSQAKALCRDYINSRLIRAGVSWSKPEHNTPVPGGKLAEVSAILLRLGDELEYIRPNVYRNIARQLNISLHSETVVTDAFLAVAAQIFTAGITWGKVVSLYAVAAGLAVDCVRHAQPAMVHTIVDCLGEFVRKTLVTWLKRRGGWTSPSAWSAPTPVSAPTGSWPPSAALGTSSRPSSSCCCPRDESHCPVPHLLPHSRSSGRGL
ncbi:bcl-2-related ovarian killer protein isoform X1 [Meleagris gallopavo]|uniref:bcl-2-related ovarian killer protein isoform X1 n=2 Tax=Phasianidae TaxID=9005 RepID=UPI000549D2DA|nr:bcl-2-related ovarian killer protein isoform X1 [Meleagris gallopavo]XP_010714807.1 bcl-2-related ovarian killer protein isoform X1 [Meleagris gallopavo]